MVDDILGKEETAVDRQHMEILLDGVKDYAILLLDTRGCVLSWNDGATLLFGYHAAEVIGQSYLRVLHPGGRRTPAGPRRRSARPPLAAS